MSPGNIAFLALVIGAFSGFAVALALASASYVRARDRRNFVPRRTATLAAQPVHA